MPGVPACAEVRHGDHRTQGRLMWLLGRLTRRVARPRFLYPGELSPHLMRDIGLGDGDIRCPRPRS